MSGICLLTRGGGGGEECTQSLAPDSLSASGSKSFLGEAATGPRSLRGGGRDLPHPLVPSPLGRGGGGGVIPSIVLCPFSGVPVVPCPFWVGGTPVLSQVLPWGGGYPWSTAPPLWVCLFQTGTAPPSPNPGLDTLRRYDSCGFPQEDSQFLVRRYFKNCSKVQVRTCCFSSK